MEETRPNVFMQFTTALCQPHRYWTIFTLKKGKLALLTTLILFVLTFAAFPLRLKSTLGSKSELKDALNENIPDFELSNGSLYMPQDYVYDQDSIFIYASSNIDSVSKKDVITLVDEQGYETVLIFSSNNCVMYANNQIQSYDYSTYSSLTLTKDSFLKIVDFFYAGMGFVVFFILVGFAIGYLFLSLLYVFAGLILQALIKLPQRLTFGQMFSLCLCAKLPLFIIRRILDLCNVSLSINTWLGTALTIGYLVLALLSIKNNYQPQPYWNAAQGYGPYENYPGYQNPQQNMNPYQQYQQPQQYNQVDPVQPYATSLESDDNSNSNGPDEHNQ